MEWQIIIVYFNKIMHLNGS